MASVYQNAEEINDIFVRMFNQINAEEPDALDSLAKSKMVIKFELTEPTTNLWVDARTKPVKARCGDDRLSTTLTAIVSGDTFHELLLGTLPIGKGISSGRLKVKGSIFKALKLEDLLHHCQKRYPLYAAELSG